MKKLYYFTVTLFILCFVILSCNKEAIEDKQDVGLIVFNYDQVSTSSKGVQTDSLTSTQPQAIVISIIDDAGNIVLNMQEISLYNMNGNYISKPVAVKKGSYRLTDFLVVNEYGEVLYLTPKESSSKAYLVSDPLPVGFSVSKDQVTNLRVEVIQNQGETPEEYGYSTFSFNVVDVIDFHVAVFTYDDSIQNFQLTGADIVIKKEGTIVYSNTVEPITNIIPLREEEGVYEISVIKEGYQGYSVSLTLDELKEYSEGQPLKVILQIFDIEEGLVAYYTFADGKVEDLTGNGNNGVINGAVSVDDRFSLANESFHFDSEGDNIVVDNPSFLDNTQGTFLAWVKFDSLSNSPMYVASVSDTSSIESYISLIRLDPETHTLGLYQREPGNANWINGTTVIETNNYYHVAMKSNGSSWSIYINGEKEELVIKKGSNVGKWIGNLVNLDVFTIGNLVIKKPYDVPNIKGNIDEILLYNRALTDNEIKLIYETKK